MAFTKPMTRNVFSRQNEKEFEEFVDSMKPSPYKWQINLETSPFQKFILPMQSLN
jgi:hypothetical protein